MMDKDLLARSVAEVLSAAGFMVSAICDIRPRSFDLVARREDLLLLIKVLSNIDGLNERTASEIIRLSRHLYGQPLLVGEKTRDQWLEQGAVYFRYGVPTVSLNTLADYIIDGMPPLVYAAHGGLYVRIDGSLLHRLRIERDKSLGELASELGVSRRTVSKYESESMDTSIDVALRLEEIFDREMIQAVDLFRVKPVEETGAEAEDTRPSQSPAKDNVLQALIELGLKVFPIDQAPFNAITRDGRMVVLTGVSKFSSSMVKKAKLMSNLSSVTMTHSAVIIEGETRYERIDQTALIERRELDNMDSKTDFADLVLEKRKERDL